MEPAIPLSFIQQLPLRTKTILEKRMEFVQPDNTLLQMNSQIIPSQTILDRRFGFTTTVHDTIDTLETHMHDIKVVDISSSQKESQFPLKFIRSEDTGPAQVYMNEGVNCIRMGPATLSQAICSIRYFHNHFLKLPSSTWFSTLFIPNMLMHGLLKPINGSYTTIMQKIENNEWRNKPDDFNGSSINIIGMLSDKEHKQKHTEGNNIYLIAFTTGMVTMCGMRSLADFIAVMDVVDMLYEDH